MSSRLSALSLFAGGGIAETYFKEIGIDIKVANELLSERAEFYKYCYPDTKMICGDISLESIFCKVMDIAKEEKINFILATPPCQGMSTLGKKEYEIDTRNGLVQYVISAINLLNPNYVLIENVPKFIQLYYEHSGKKLHIVDLLEELFNDRYKIEMRLLNAKDYGIPQSRPRVIIKLYKKNLNWPWPKEDDRIITLREAIGDLPSLEAGDKSTLKWHKALSHNQMQVEALQHTPEGKSAMKNPVYFPKKRDGTPVKGFHNTYKRMKWDEPAPARTTNNHLMSGHNNVHPGRELADGTWSDARVLTFRELIIVSSLPLEWNIPKNSSEVFVRQIIGEAIPPLLSKKIAEQILIPKG